MVYLDICSYNIIKPVLKFLNDLILNFQIP